MKKTSRKVFSSETDNEISDISGTTEKRNANTIKSFGVYCSLIENVCKNDQCEICPALHSTYGGYWKCVYCVNEKDLQLPFWGDAECSVCGNTYGVLIYCVKH
jgi:hypothetical protein